MDKARNHGATARRLLRARHSGTLATLSKRLDGHPFASAIRYVADADGCPVVMVSGLAEHTRNLQADPRVSLLVLEPGPDPQAESRLTLMGKAVPASDPQDARERYLRYFPDASRYLELPDFRPVSIRPDLVRFIGGFGDIRWIQAESFRAPVAGWSEAAARAALERAGNDALRRLWEDAPESPEVLVAGVDCDGIDLRVGSQLRRLEFAAPVHGLAALEEAIHNLLDTAPRQP